MTFVAWLAECAAFRNEWGKTAFMEPQYKNPAKKYNGWRFSPALVHNSGSCMFWGQWVASRKPGNAHYFK